MSFQPIARCLVACLTALCCCSTLTAAEPRDISDVLAPLLKATKLPGLAGAIVTKDGLVAWGAVGVRKRGSTVPLTVHDQFHIGSCSKSMTATVIARLIEQKVLTWQTSPADVFAALKTVDPAWKKVTVLDLLRHRSGLVDHFVGQPLWSELYKRTGTPRDQRLQLVTALLAEAPENPVGTKFEYSNGGYALAGAMAEQLTNTAWEELVQRELCTPLKLTGVGWQAPGTPEKLDQPWGHTEQGEPVTPGTPQSDNPNAIGPAGTLHLPLAAWAKYATQQLAPQTDPRYLSVESDRYLHEPRKWFEPKQPLLDPPYACGWISLWQPWANSPVLLHSGSNTMWVAQIALSQKKGLGVLTACNQGGTAADTLCEEAATALLEFQQKSK